MPTPRTVTETLTCVPNPARRIGIVHERTGNVRTVTDYVVGGTVLEHRHKSATVERHQGKDDVSSQP